MLNGKIIAISGGAGLIGSGFSHSVVRNGGKVIVGDINNKKGNELVEELGPSNSFFVKLDVSSTESINDLFDSAYNKYGRVDGVVHCAYPRSTQWGTKFEDLQADGLAEDLFGQLGGAILFSQCAMAFFLKQGFGNLVHIASIQGLGAPKFEHYVATNMASPIEYGAIKAGIISITKYLAKYYGKNNIRTNCISPGGIIDDQPAIFLENYKKSCSNKGMLDVEDLIGALLYLLSDYSKYVNGQNLIVDDGWSL